MTELSKYERRKQVKHQEQQIRERRRATRKIGKYGLIMLLVGVAGWRVAGSLQQSPEQVQLEQAIKETSLEGRVEEFESEGREHVAAGSEVWYKTNPPTSGPHLSQAESWGVYDREIDDLAGVHSLEHGGIWISYKGVEEGERQELEAIGRANPGSTLVSPRGANEDRIVVVSWGRMMRLKTVDRPLIQKYVETYKNNSPERLAQ